MTRRLIVRGLLAGALVLAMAVPALAAAETRTQAGSSYPWAGVSRLGLEYYLQYVPASGEVRLLVINDSSKPVTVEFPTAQQVDFVLRSNAVPVWRWSDGQSFAQVMTSETIQAGQAKVYKVVLPWVPPGLYAIQAFFLAESRWQPVAGTYVWIDRGEPLSYSVNFVSRSLWNPYPRLRVVIKNESGRDVRLPSRYGYQVLVRRVGSSEYLPGTGVSESIGYIQNGASRYVFVNLKGLTPGWYEAEVRSNVATGRYLTVARARFYLW